MKTLNNYINEALIKKDTKIKKEDELIYNFEEFIKQINGQSKFGNFENKHISITYDKFEAKKCYSIDHGKFGIFYYFILDNLEHDYFIVLQIMSPISSKPLHKIKIIYRKLNQYAISVKDYLFFNTNGNQVNLFYVNDIFIKKFIELLNQLYDANDGKMTLLINNFEKYCHKNKLYIDNK